MNHSQLVSNYQELESASHLAERLNLHFSDWSLLTRALTHRSFLNEHADQSLEDNERLEFLGDAVLDFIVAAWLYNRFPEMEEGALTRMRSALVHTQQLAAFSAKIHLGYSLRLGKGEDNAGGRSRNALLCDAFESLIGAIYLDSGLDSVKKFFFPLLESAIDEIFENHRFQDSKSYLQEWAQSQGYVAPVYVTRNSLGPDHSRIFEVEVCVNQKTIGEGKGSSKQIAEKDAAYNALKELGLLNDAYTKMKT